MLHGRHVLFPGAVNFVRSAAGEVVGGLGEVTLPALDRLCANNPQTTEPQGHGVHTT